MLLRGSLETITPRRLTRPVGKRQKNTSALRASTRQKQGSGGRVCFGPSSVAAVGVLATVQAALVEGYSADNNPVGRGSDL